MPLRTTVRTTRTHIDFRKLGFEAARETRDMEKAKQVCAQELRAYELSLQPAMENRRRGIDMRTAKKDALCAQLYGDPNEPVSDKKMLTRAKLIKVLMVVLAAVFLMSVAAHAYRLALFGWGIVLAVAGGIVATLFVAGVGYLAFEKLLQNRTP